MLSYIVASDDYMGSGYHMLEVRAPSFLSLLTDYFDCGMYGETVKEMVEGFNSINGDGQPYFQVWSVAEGKKVLG